MGNIRLRDLGISLGEYPPGPFNAITDVPGVLVGQATLIQDHPSIARTGVTAVFPRTNIHRDFVFAAFHNFNGIGEMTGLPFLEETGLLVGPVLLTHTSQVGMVYDAVVRYGARKFGGFAYKLPVVGETWDGWLSESDAFPLKEEHVIAALESASSGPVAEGNTGGGTGMISYEFKGGTGTASRRVDAFGQVYTLGALVQANQGNRPHLRVDGVPAGRLIPVEEVPSPWGPPPFSSSILILIATDAPLMPHQLKRLAQRGVVGLARTGGYGLDISGDLILAFSTGIHYDRGKEGLLDFHIYPQFSMDPLIVAAAEAVEEAILNALAAAETMTGYLDHVAYALPHARLVEVMRTHRR